MTGNLTAQQASDLANKFLTLAQAVSDFRYANWDSMSKADNQKLAALQMSILNAGEDITALSTTLVLDEVQSSLTEIYTVSDQIKTTLKSLENVQKGLNIAGSIVNLGSAIISKSPQGVAFAVKGLADTALS
jgi:hypothetical protein